MNQTVTNKMRRRSFIRNMALGGVGASLAAAVSARAQSGGGLTKGDVAILHFLAAAASEAPTLPSAMFVMNDLRRILFVPVWFMVFPLK